MKKLSWNHVLIRMLNSKIKYENEIDMNEMK